MKRLILPLVASLALFGCDKADDSIELKTATTPITEENAVAIAVSSMDASETALDFAPSSNSADVSAKGILRTLPIARASESFDCPDGGSITLNGDDSVSGSAEAGSGQAVITYDNCEAYGTTTDGEISLDMTWTGFDYSTFETLEVELELVDLTVNDGDNESLDHGTLSISLDDSGILSTDWWLSTKSSATDYGIVNTYTVEPLIMSMNDSYPTSGVWMVEGSDDTDAKATVVANGLEVEVNGGAATLYTWAELGMFQLYSTNIEAAFGLPFLLAFVWFYKISSMVIVWRFVNT